MAKRFAVFLSDDELATAVKAAADAQKMSLAQFAAAALRQAVVGLSDAAVSCLVCQERRNNDKERYRHQRQNAGKPARLKAAPFRTTGVLLPRLCPLCDIVFTPPIRAQHQKYCSQLHTRYAFTYNHDMAKARPAYAAFMVRRQQGSKR